MRFRDEAMTVCHHDKYKPKSADPVDNSMACLFFASLHAGVWWLHSEIPSDAEMLKTNHLIVQDWVHMRPQHVWPVKMEKHTGCAHTITDHTR